MKNKFIRKWLVILTVAAMMIPAGIPANAETVEEGENIAPTAGISAETPNVTAETQKEEISAEMPDMTAETQNEEKSDVQAEGQNQAKQGVLEAVRQNTEKAEEASDAVDVQAEERTAPAASPRWPVWTLRFASVPMHWTLWATPPPPPARASPSAPPP